MPNPPDLEGLRQQTQTATLAALLGNYPQGFGQALGQGIGQGRLTDGESPGCTWKVRWGAAERRALRLFRDMYGLKRMLCYLHQGYVDYHASCGRTYRIFREAHREIEVFQRLKTGKKLLYRLCVIDMETIPLTDGVMKRLWLAKADPATLHQQANVKAAGG